MIVKPTETTPNPYLGIEATSQPLLTSRSHLLTRVETRVEAVLLESCFHIPSSLMTKLLIEFETDLTKMQT